MIQDANIRMTEDLIINRQRTAQQAAHTLLKIRTGYWGCYEPALIPADMVTLCNQVRNSLVTDKISSHDEFMIRSCLASVQDQVYRGVMN